MDTKTGSIYMLSTRDDFRPRDTYSLNVRGWKKVFHTNGKQKKVGVAILLSEKIYFKSCYKRHRLAEWIQKQDLYICCLQDTHFRPRDTNRLKVRGWKRY